MFKIDEKNTIFSSIILTFLLFTLDILFTLFLFTFIDNTLIINILSGLFIIIFVILTNKNNILNNKKKIEKREYIKIFIVFIIAFILTVILNKLFINIFNIEVTNEILIKNNIKKYLLLSIISTGFISPIKEEFIYRLPFLYNNKLKSYITYSITFALIHIISIKTSVEFIYIIPYLIMSFGIGYGYFKTNNILVSTMLHILNNLLNIMLLFI